MAAGLDPLARIASTSAMAATGKVTEATRTPQLSLALLMTAPVLVWPALARATGALALARWVRGVGALLPEGLAPEQLQIHGERRRGVIGETHHGNAGERIERS